MIDVKKFIGVFLLLAILAGASALYFAATGSGGGLRPAQGNQAFTIGSSTAAPQNAFDLGNPNQTDANGIYGEAYAAQDASSSSLTSALADSIINNILATNPDGPQTDSNGNSVLNAIDANAVVGGIATSSAYENIKIPDWDFEAEMLAAHIETVSSGPNVAQYPSAVSSILQQNASDVSSIASSSAQSSDIQELYTQTANTVQALSNLTVPKDLVDFHKSLLTVLVYQKNALALAENSSDPYEASIILQGEEDKYNAAVQKLQDEAEKAAASWTVSSNTTSDNSSENGWVVAVNSVLGIKTAHAFLFDIVSDPITEAKTTISAVQMSWSAVKNVLLQILKNTLIADIQNDMFSYVMNNGDPRFVQQWGSFLIGAYNSAAGVALGNIQKSLCPNFSNQVTSWLQSSFPGADVNSSGARGASAVKCGTSNTNNPSNTQGSISGFLSILNPNNNPYGAFAEAFDEVQRAANTAEQDAEDKAQASNGFKSPSYCEKDPKAKVKNGLCPDGSEPITTVPGNTLAQTFTDALSSNIKLVTNANDITGLTAAVSGSLLKHVIDDASSQILSGGTRATTDQTPPPSLPPVLCTASQPNASTSAAVSFSATGGNTFKYSWSAPGGNPSTGTGFDFSTSYNATGTYQVILTDIDNDNGNTTSICTENIN